MTKPTAGISTTTKPYIYTEEVDWIIPVAINITLTVITIIILISLIHYGIKAKKWQSTRRSDHEKLHAGAIYGCVVLCSVMCIFRYASSMAAMNTGFGIGKDQLCDRIADLAYCAYALVLFCIALFLWLRQRVFFVNKMLNVSYQAWIKVISFFSCFLLIAMCSFVIIYNIVPLRYKSTKQGCIYQPDNKVKEVFWIIGSAGLLVVQFSLLGLFAYALLSVKSNRNNKNRCKHNKNDKKYNLIKSVTVVSTTAQQEQHLKTNKKMKENKTKTRNLRKIKQILIKTLVLAILSTIADIFIQVFATYIIDPNGHRRLSHMIFDINTFINLMFFVFSFSAAKQMLTFSWCQ